MREVKSDVNKTIYILLRQIDLYVALTCWKINTRPSFVEFKGIKFNFHCFLLILKGAGVVKGIGLSVSKGG